MLGVIFKEIDEIVGTVSLQDYSRTETVELKLGTTSQQSIGGRALQQRWWNVL
jgi:hypothetical protein